MSVAFRRESDEEHREPRFELPIPPGPNLVTARGLGLITAKVTELECAQRAAIAAEDVSRIARELRYWHTRRVTAELVSPPVDEIIAFGSRVRFRLAGRERTIDIVGHDEADPARDGVSYTAPLARVLIGAMPGDHVAFGGREDAIEVLTAEAIGT